jgi:hypothetical protein
MSISPMTVTFGGRQHELLTRVLVCTALAVFSSTAALAQFATYPPGTFAIDGIPVNCGPNVTTILNPYLNDAGMSDGHGNIILNPVVLGNLPTVLKLYWFAHECGHYNVGPSEVAADCWAITTGRNQGWFPPEAFQALMSMFQNNPGDMAHPSGPQRVQNMWYCYKNH